MIEPALQVLNRRKSDMKNKKVWAGQLCGAGGSVAGTKSNLTGGMCGGLHITDSYNVLDVNGVEYFIIIIVEEVEAILMQDHHAPLPRS